MPCLHLTLVGVFIAHLLSYIQYTVLYAFVNLKWVPTSSQTANIHIKPNSYEGARWYVRTLSDSFMIPCTQIRTSKGCPMQSLIGIVLLLAAIVLWHVAQNLKRIYRRHPMPNDPRVFQSGGFVMNNRDGSVRTSVRLTTEAMRPQRNDY